MKYKNPFNTVRTVLVFAVNTGCLISTMAFAQPQYSTNFVTTTSSSQIPFNSNTQNKVQWLYKPSDFGNVPSGSITKIYLRAQQSMLPVVLSINGLSIKIGETTLSQLPPGPWISAGMTTVYTAATFNTVPLPNNWIEIVLQTPFAYDNTKNFILEASHTGVSVGFDIMQAAINYRSLYGSGGSLMANTQNVLLDFGFTMGSSVTTTDAGLIRFAQPPDTLCNDNMYPISVWLKNFGNTVLSSVQINCFVNNQVQPATPWTGSLQPGDSSQVIIGSIMPAASVIPVIRAYTSNPNFMPDQNNSNDTVIKTGFVVLPAPLAVISPAGNQSLCPGDSLLLSTGTGVSYTYQWYNSGTPVAGATGSSLSVSQAGSYTVRVMKQALCWTLSVPTVVSLSPIPTVNLGPDQSLAASHSLTLDAGAGHATYLWSTGATTQTLLINGSQYTYGPHTFGVTVSNTQTCTNSDSVVITIIDDTGLENLSSESPIKVFPNPTSENIFIDYSGDINDFYSLYFYSADGKLLYQTDFVNIKLNSLFQLSFKPAKGLYYLHIIGNKTTSLHKVIIN